MPSPLLLHERSADSSGRGDERKKSTGSLYLHCDPTSSHYLKLLLDAVFGPEQFRGEIWTIEELLSGAQLDAPPTRQVDRRYRKPPRVATSAPETPRLDFEEPPTVAARLPERAKPAKAGLGRQRRTNKKAG